MRMGTFSQLLGILGLSLGLFNEGLQAQPQPLRTLIVTFDGLRPDYITPAAMPRLHAFRQTASQALEHHSVFPTVTRVNTSSFATGSYPKTHGILGNAVYFPGVHPTKALDTGDAKALQAIDDNQQGDLLTTPSLGEQLQQAGHQLMVFSSGTTGQALLQNRKGSGGLVINPGLIIPATAQDSIYQAFGPPPAYAIPNTARHRWVVDALLRYGLVAKGPLVCSLWLSDPDATAHVHGVGRGLTQQALAQVDQEFGRILDSLQTRRLLGHYNILVSTDHGFVTHQGKTGYTDLLIAKGLKASRESDDVVLADGAIYVKGHDRTKIQQIVQVLQAEPWVGAVFTPAGTKNRQEGWVKGTLSFESIHWNHASRTADILVDVNWTDEKNDAGYPGQSFAKGTAGHGSLSPYEVHTNLFAAGPGFKKGMVSQLPTSIIDLIPTVLYLHGLPRPASMDGRVLNELLLRPEKTTYTVPRKETLRTKASYAGGTYTLALQRTLLGPYIYIDYGKVERMQEPVSNSAH
ncbi:alkaline phosphatase family protein [Siphonobacter sp. BAB-5405]|uniref:alkaline phosphatase family protein n=1 Tax=Siphonobacter sp. BAB-5405 TaxID=1864825 RepID=UPI000C803036|nr:alkaline phosphatase family protein [Siphonobacter sp. BAB-5405]PMD90761.1 alkaline phosphatase family protein [Siphonobacter sp. BAB-5405]